MPNNILKKFLERSESGQSLVEMAFGFTILIILASGLLDLGRVYFTFVALEDGAGDGVLYASINPACLVDTGGTSDGECDDPENAEHRARTAGGEFVDWTTATINVFCNGAPATVGGSAIACELGDQVSVDISYDFNLLTPVIPEIVGGGTLPLQVNATNQVIGE